MELANLDGRKCAVVYRVARRELVLRGTAHYERAPHQEYGTLRIQFSGQPQGNAQLIIDESQWCGSVVDGNQLGCDFRIDLVASPMVPLPLPGEDN